ncbi:MAG: hypothetical protein ACOCRX_06850 [Candidatus Woesearchaeota archaeon]
MAEKGKIKKQLNQYRQFAKRNKIKGGAFAAGVAVFFAFTFITSSLGILTGSLAGLSTVFSVNSFKKAKENTNAAKKLESQVYNKEELKEDISNDLNPKKEEKHKKVASVENEKNNDLER